ncbi:MAG: PEP-CTERM sorting domain-containing protein [Betaproteobacteria bacterium]
MNAKIVVLLLAMLPPVAMAAPGVIDFETVPGGVAADQVAISNQYQAGFGVTFSLSTGAVPFLEQVGDTDPGRGFYNTGLGVYDAAAAGFASQLGNYFLRIGTGSLQTAPMPQLVITYTTPVAAASAQIWDIDGNASGSEQWLVEAFGSGGGVIDSVVSPLATTEDALSLDGKPWTWSFNHGGSADIFALRLSFTGSKSGGIGLALDNFSPAAPVPEPSTWWLMICSAGLLAVARRRKIG